MKENKFRLIHKKTGEVVDVDMELLFDMEANFPCATPQDFHILQYIGTHDRRGVDMYEGDIIENSDGERHVIMWDDDSLSYIANDLKSGDDVYAYMSFSECKIVGSMYK